MTVRLATYNLLHGMTVLGGMAEPVRDATGKVGILQGSSITVGGPVGSAIAASAVAGGVLVVNTQDGSIISLNK